MYPVHYLPIFGEKKLDRVQFKDSVKHLEAHRLGISLLVIDVSAWNTKKRQDAESASVFNSVIKPLIEEKLAGASIDSGHSG